MKAHTEMKLQSCTHANFSIKPNIFLIVNYTAWLKLHEKTGEKTKETNATATHRDNGET